MFFVFQFHIRLPNYGFGNTLHCPPKIKVSSKFIFWDKENQIRKFFGPKILICLV